MVALSSIKVTQGTTTPAYSDEVGHRFRANPATIQSPAQILNGLSAIAFMAFYGK